MQNDKRVAKAGGEVEIVQGEENGAASLGAGLQHVEH